MGLGPCPCAAITGYAAGVKTLGTDVVIKSVVTAAVATLLLIGLYVWWFQAPWTIVIVYGVLSVCALATVPLCYRWFGFLDRDIIQQLIDQEAREHDDMIRNLNKLQSDLTSLDNEQGSNQVATLRHLLNDFHEVIANRFRGKQLSSSTYMDAARNVQNQALQNLSDMVGIGHSISSLKRQSAAIDTSQLTTQTERLQALVQENDKLFKALSDTSVEVANIQEIGAFERTETLARLKDLTKIAKNQSR